MIVNFLMDIFPLRICGSSLSGLLRTVAAYLPLTTQWLSTGREWLIRSHSSARFCFDLSGNSN